MLHGEYESMDLIHKMVPEFSPKPLFWGKCKDSDCHFLLFSFHDLRKDLPSTPRFSHAVAQLHTLSLGENPTGKFGFHITTYNGILPQDNRWTDTWEEFYANGMRRMLELEREARGPSDELEQLSGPFFDKVIPRLLRPMETNGRSLKPVLLHGDLWIGNTAAQEGSDEPFMFDSSAFWGHHECEFQACISLPLAARFTDIRATDDQYLDELATMRTLENDWGRECTENYHRLIPKSEPNEDWDARNALYST